MGEYDVALRYMARTSCNGALGELGARKVVSTMETEFPSVRDRRVDYLALVEGRARRRWLQQIEFQSHRDGGMLGRMVGYRGDIADWLTSRSAERHGGSGLPREIRQTVLYVGQDRWAPVTSVRERNFRFTYTFVDIRDLRPERLLESGHLGDAVLAVLCDDEAKADRVREVLNRISRVSDPVAAADALVQLRVLAKLRGGGARVEQEIEAMGVTVNVEDSRMLREPLDRARELGREEGREEGMAEMVARLLAIRFGDAMPAGVDLSEHLQGLKRDVLRSILDRGVTADSIEAALGTHMPATPSPTSK